MILLASMPGGSEWLLILLAVFVPFYLIYTWGQRRGKRKAEFDQMKKELEELKRVKSS